MPNPFIKRFQKHVTIKVPTDRSITIVNTGSGVTLVSHPKKRNNAGYANISLTASDIDLTNPNKTDMDEKIEATLSRLKVINDNVKGNEEKNVGKMISSKEKRGPSLTYFMDSPQLDGQYDYLKSRLVKVHDVMLDKVHRKQVNNTFKQMGFKRGIGREQVHQIGELYSDNPV